MFLEVLALSALLTACGAVTSAPPAPVVVTVTPALAQPFPGTGVQFRASVQNAAGSTVVWQVNQASGGNATVGTIDSNGYYRAPNSVPSPATVTVTAVLQGGSNASGSAQVTIQSLAAIRGPLTLSPRLASVTETQTLQLQVTTPGVTATDVAWQVDGFGGGNASVGTISATGLYTPPASAGPHTVTAILNANASTVGLAQVEVTDFAGNLTWRNDNARSGINSHELALSPAAISTPAPGGAPPFGKLFSCPIDGYAYAQPLYVPNLPINGKMHNVVFVATEKDSVFAFDADAKPCMQIWQANLVPSGLSPISANIPNQDLSFVMGPLVGITGTPVIDPARSALYVVIATQSMGSSPSYSHWLVDLDIQSGNSLILPSGTPIAAAQFESLPQNQRAALLLDNSTVYVAFGSYKSEGTYHGWLFAYDSTSLRPTGLFNVTQVPATGGGIWQSGGGPAADIDHNVFVVAGGGPFNANRAPNPPDPNFKFSYGDSFLRLRLGTDLFVSDYFTPCEATSQVSGLEVGSSAPLLLPPDQPHLVIGGSKGGALYVVNRDSMGGYCPKLLPQIVAVGGAVTSTPLFWNSAVYVAPGNAHLQALPFLAGVFAGPPAASQSPETLGPLGATPVLSSNGSSNAVLWLIDAAGATTSPNGPAILRAYDPNNLSSELYNSAAAGSRDQAGPAVKFTVPTVANGKVYVGTQTELDVYGLLD